MPGERGRAPGEWSDPALAAAGRARNPVGVVVAPDGRVYFVDSGTNQLKVL